MNKALDTYEYLFSQSWINHYLYSNSKPYIYQVLFIASVLVCCGLLNIALEKQIRKHEDIKDH